MKKFYYNNRLFEYIYDAYGNILNISSLTAIAKINPYRYKGYYFDSETNLYYCKSRYYSPEIIRWISQDEISYLDISSVNGCNLYTYCNNNPIMYVDDNGNIALWAICVAAIIVAAVVVVAVNYIVSACQYADVAKNVQEKYTKEEAETAIEKITGKNNVKINDNEVYIENSEEIKSRYERILISKIITNTVDENDNYITNRTTFGLAAEWCGHNAFAHLNIAYETTAHVNLDNDFRNNKWYTELGTGILLGLGFL